MGIIVSETGKKMRFVESTDKKAIAHNAHCSYRFKVQSCDCINFVRAIEQELFWQI